MGVTKVDISSTAIEKGIDLIKDFLGKLIGPTIEETGLLLADNIKLYRFKNQLGILEKAQKIVKERNIDTKKVSLKILVPLLEYSSLEEDETLQEKWVNLLVNYIDSKEKYESTIFPFILSQLTSTEACDLENFRENTLNLLKESAFVGGLANLTRLGLINKTLPKLEAKEETTMRRKRIIVSYSNKGDWYEITELGKQFLDAVREQKSKQP